jgi:small-conductance mechanosensitive channel
MLEALDSLKQVSWGGNSLYDYLAALAIFFGSLAALRIIQLVVLRRLRKIALKTANDFDDVLIEIFSGLRPPFYLLVPLYLSVYSLSMQPLAATVVKFGFLVTVVYELVGGIGKLSNYFVSKKFQGNGDDESARQARTAANAIRLIVQIVLWAVGLLVVLSNLGVNVNSLIASLGVGGIAVALAAQNILGDVFSSFTIFFDKPFVIGDFIVVGDKSGTVERIGLKTTRLRALTGEALLMPNKDLVASSVHNFKQMRKRRGVTSLGVEYGTSHEKLVKLPDIVKRLVDDADGVDFDRCHFVGYGDFSLNFEVVYYVDSPDYGVFLDRQQGIYLAIYKEFAAQGIEFAFPTQTILTKPAS